MVGRASRSAKRIREAFFPLPKCCCCLFGYSKQTERRHLRVAIPRQSLASSVPGWTGAGVVKTDRALAIGSTISHRAVLRSVMRPRRSGSSPVPPSGGRGCGRQVPCDGAVGLLTEISDASKVNGRARLKLERLYIVSTHQGDFVV